MYYGYIYLIRNKLNNKIYIGKKVSSKFVNNYWGSGKLIKLAIEKYGKENFTREVIYWSLANEDLCEKEKYYIKLFDARDPDIGYNICVGGEGVKGGGGKGGMKGKHHSEEAKLKIRLSNLGKNTGKSHTGYHHTEEAKRRMSEKHKGKSSWNKGKHLSEEHRRKIKENWHKCHGPAWNKGKKNIYSEEVRLSISKKLKEYNKIKREVNGLHYVKREDSKS